MNLFDKLSNGWKLSINSLKILKANKKLIIFPILSGVSMILIIGSFVVALFASSNWDIDYLRSESTTEHYLYAFLFYLVNYFVVVFFNTALIQCTRDYFNGEVPSVMKGLRFSVTRIGAIFTWALFAATVGLILRTIQENVGALGKIITSIFGIVWSIATFFVVPVIAYENLNPIQAIKRSTQMMKDKWGESLGAGFSFGLLRLVALLVVCLPLFLFGLIFSAEVGIIFACLGVFFVMAVSSATNTIFISAVYHNINGDPVSQFNEKFAENLFLPKN